MILSIITTQIRGGIFFDYPPSPNRSNQEVKRIVKQIG
jgi:hypothetical protein